MKVDSQKTYAVAKHFDVKKLPTLILLHNGEQIDRYEGVLTAQDLDARLCTAMAASEVPAS